MTNALAIFVKTPGFSPIKTRLAASIGTRAATEFHCLAARAVAEVAAAAGNGLQSYWAVAERAAMGDPLWQDLPRLWQGEGSLGERLHQIYSTLQAMHERVLLVGADAPQITPALLQQATCVLESGNRPFALGDARDGGFWLFGGRESIARETWCGVRYSQADTAAQLRNALRVQGEVATLPMLNDVDAGQDLASLAEALALLDPLPTQRALARWLHFTRMVTA